LFQEFRHRRLSVFWKHFAARLTKQASAHRAGTRSLLRMTDWRDGSSDKCSCSPEFARSAPTAPSMTTAPEVTRVVPRLYVGFLEARLCVAPRIVPTEILHHTRVSSPCSGEHISPHVLGSIRRMRDGVLLQPQRQRKIAPRSLARCGHRRLSAPGQRPVLIKYQVNHSGRIDTVKRSSLCPSLYQHPIVGATTRPDRQSGRFGSADL
jgi:hypothetical protein